MRPAASSSLISTSSRRPRRSPTRSAAALVRASSALSDRPPATGPFRAGHPPVRVFSEARLHRAADGTVHAADHSSGAAVWDVYVERLGAVELAARVGPADTSALVPVGRIEVRPLPFYSGPR